MTWLGTAGVPAQQVGCMVLVQDSGAANSASVGVGGAEPSGAARRRWGMRSIARTLSAWAASPRLTNCMSRDTRWDCFTGPSRRGEILRPRKGWYASHSCRPRQFEPGESVDVWRARARSAPWPWSVDDKLHIEVPITASRLRSPNDRRVSLNSIEEPGNRHQWASTRSPGNRFSVSMATAVRQVFDCCGDVAGFGGARIRAQRRSTGQADMADLLDALPRRSKQVALLANHLSDSGGESELNSCC